MSNSISNAYPTRHSTIKVVCSFLLFIFILPALACKQPEEEAPWAPENPKQYTAETAPVEVYVAIDSAGNVVDFDGPVAYYAVAKLKYVLCFWDVGNRMDGYNEATISRVYTPLKISEISDDLEDQLSADQIAEIYARTSFPSTEVPLHKLSFTGGPFGDFLGENSETGETILGHIQWENENYELGGAHVIFVEGIRQDYLILGEELFYNWP